MKRHSGWCRSATCLVLAPGILLMRPALLRGQAVPETRVPPLVERLSAEERLSIPLLNRAVVEEAVREVALPKDGSPLQLKVRLGLDVDSAGLVQQVTIDTSSCLPVVDSMALRLAGLMRYARAGAGSAASLRSTTAQMFFGADSFNLTLPDDSLLHKKPSADSSFYDVGPRLLNHDYIGGLLAANYPRDLRKKGIGGQAVIWVLVDTTGLPLRRGVRRGSGQCELDLAALRVADGMRFTAAQKHGRPVPLWVQLPIVFRTK